MNNQRTKTVVALAVAGFVSVGLLQAQSHDHSGHNHDHSGHDHSGHNHDHSGHDHGPADQISGDTITLTERDQRAMRLVMESIEMRPLADGRDDVVALPHSSIVDSGDKYFVFIQDESDASKFIRSEVTLGKSDQRYVDALTGVFPGDNVIARGAQQIGAPREFAADDRHCVGDSCPLSNSNFRDSYDSRRVRDRHIDCPLGNDRFDHERHPESDYRYYDGRRDQRAYRERRDRDDDGFLSRIRNFRFR